MQQRPTVVTVLAVLWMLVSVLALVGSAGGLFFWFSGSFGGGPLPDSADTPGFSIFRYYGALASAQLVFGLVAGAASVGLFRLREWARKTIQALSWLGLVGVLAMSAYQVSITRSFLAEDGGAGMVYFFIGAVVFFSLFWMTPLILSLWALGRDSVREAFTDD